MKRRVVVSVLGIALGILIGNALLLAVTCDGKRPGSAVGETVIGSGNQACVAGEDQWNCPQWNYVAPPHNLECQGTARPDEKCKDVKKYYAKCTVTCGAAMDLCDWSLPGQEDYTLFYYEGTTDATCTP